MSWHTNTPATKQTQWLYELQANLSIINECMNTTYHSALKIKHGDRFHAHTRKFNHELVLQTVRMRMESETIVLSTVHVRKVNNEKTSLACRARARKTMVNKHRMSTRNVTTWWYLCSVRAHEPQGPKRVRRRAHLLIVCNGSKLAALHIGCYC